MCEAHFCSVITLQDREDAMKRKYEIDQLEQKEELEKEEWIRLLSDYDEDDRKYAAERAREVTQHYFGKQIYIRGLIEFTSYCRNDCYYCGLRRSNKRAQRYRLSEEEILSCCQKGYELGFKTFVLQGGEDVYYTDERMEDLICEIKKKFPDCALTLSIGEKESAAYERFYKAGADRYLLRHETANAEHYGQLHPAEMSLQHRKACLWQLKNIGYQTGCGFMVGSPGQTAQALAEDMLFIHELHPHMVGIGPFLPHRDTPFGKEPGGSYELTLFLLSLLRLMEKNVLLPSTTALGTIAPDGREKGILAGANVVMPNLSPVTVRKKYSLYDNKICTGDETAECIHCLTERMHTIGYQIVSDRGDWKARKI